MKKRSLIKSALVPTALAIVVSACSPETPPEESVVNAAARDTALLGAEAVAIANFALDSAQRVQWSTRVTAPARVTLDPTRQQTLGSITEGRITRVLVRVGDPVRAGEIVVAIHSHEIMDARSGLVRAESQTRTAIAERDAAQIAMQRAERLLAARAMGQADVERARVTLVAAQARLDEAEADSERAHGLLEHLLGDGPLPANLDPHEVLIRSPMSGVVTERTAVPGTVVLPGDPLLSVADPRALQLEIRLTDRQIAGVTAGDSIEFSLVGSDASEAVGMARVTRVSPVLDQETRTTLVVATITRAPAGTRAERFASAVLSSRSVDQALVVPAQAIQSLAGDTVVIVAERRGEGLHLEAVPVRVGRRDAVHAEILAGLEAGRVVIARGATIARAELLKLREGAGGAEH